MASPTRNILDVISRLLELIPNTETELINELNNYRNSLWNRAPEVINSRDCWISLQNILNRLIPVIDSNWKMELIRLFNRRH